MGKAAGAVIGAATGLLVGGLVQAVGFGISGAAIGEGSADDLKHEKCTAIHSLPICRYCLAAHDSDSVTYELANDCVALTLHNEEYGDALLAFNKGRVFPSIEECLGAVSSDEAGQPEPDMGVERLPPVDDESLAGYESVYGRKLDAVEAAIAKSWYGLVQGLSTIHTHPDIPGNMLRNAVASYARVSPESVVIGLQDSADGSAKAGMLFTLEGIHWRSRHTKEARSARYEELSPSLIACDSSGSKLILSPYQWVDLFGYHGKIPVIIAIRAFLIDAIRFTTAGRAGPSSPSHGWKLGGLPAVAPANVAKYEAIYGRPLSPLEAAIIDRWHTKVGNKENVYTYPEIPEKKFKNAEARYFKPDAGSLIIAVHDSTLWGSGKDGLIFTSTGLQWSSYGSRGCCSYADLEPRAITHSRDLVGRIVLSPDQKIDGLTVCNSTLITLCAFLADAARYSAAARTAPASSSQSGGMCETEEVCDLLDPKRSHQQPDGQSSMVEQLSVIPEGSGNLPVVRSANLAEYEAIYERPLSSLEAAIIDRWHSRVGNCSSVYTYPGIPDKKFKYAARTHFAPVSDSLVIALQDDGAIFTTTGVSWRAAGGKCSHVCYADLEPSAITYVWKPFLGRGGALVLTPGERVEMLSLDERDLAALCGFVIDAAQFSSADRAPTASPSQRADSHESEGVGDVLDAERSDQQPNAESSTMEQPGVVPEGCVDLPVVDPSKLAEYESSYGRTLSPLEAAVIDCWHAKVGIRASVYTHPDIPEKKLKNACNRYFKPDTDSLIIALQDGTVFGSANRGLVFTTTGLHWGWTNEEAGCCRYADLDPLAVTYTWTGTERTLVLTPEESITVLKLSDEDSMIALCEFIADAARLWQLDQ